VLAPRHIEDGDLVGYGAVSVDTQVPSFWRNLLYASSG
jgi:hypothetical protein